MARTFDGNAANYLGSGPSWAFPTNATLLFRAKTSADAFSRFMGHRSGGTGVLIARQSGIDGVEIAPLADVGLQAEGSFLADDTWRAYAIVKTDTSYSIYVDSTTAAATGTRSYATAGIAWFFGAYNYDGTPTDPYTGALAEIAMYARALGATDLGRWMAGDSPALYPTNLDHYWKLDETSGNAAATVGGVTLTQVGTVGTTAHPAMNYSEGAARPVFAHHYRQQGIM